MHFPVRNLERKTSLESVGMVFDCAQNIQSARAFDVVFGEVDKDFFYRY